MKDSTQIRINISILATLCHVARRYGYVVRDGPHTGQIGHLTGLLDALAERWDTHPAEVEAALALALGRAPQATDTDEAPAVAAVDVGHVAAEPA